MRHPFQIIRWSSNFAPGLKQNSKNSTGQILKNTKLTGPVDFPPAGSEAKISRIFT